MKNWLITLANGPRDSFGRVAEMKLTVYAATEAEVEAMASVIVDNMDGYWEFREAIPLE